MAQRAVCAVLVALGVSVPVLVHLELGATQVTGAGLKELAPLKALTHLGLRSTDVTDAGLKDIVALKTLRRLVVLRSGVTADGVKTVLKAIPGCQVVRW